MAEKEATVYIVDLGRSMNQSSQNRQQNDLDWALQYVWDKISNTVYVGRKTTYVGVVGLGTDETDNDMGNDDSYKHISVLQPISQILLPDLQRLPTVLKPNKTDNRDTLSAIIIAVDMIMKHCKHLQYKKKIVVVTNGTGAIDDDDLDSTASEIRKNRIELVVLGVDFDDAEYGFKEEDKPISKAKNEKILKKLVDNSGGMFGTMQEAIDGLSRPNIKPVRPTPTYKGQLRLGDPQNYDSALTIDVERYFKTQIRRPPTASSFAVKLGSQDDENLSTIQNQFTYTVKDENSTEGILNLSREDLAKGYEYGRTAVHISETDENITKLETEAAYEIIGFLPVENVERYMLMDNSNIIVAQKTNDMAALALSSLVHALFELGSVAVGRLVKKDMSEPSLTILSPLIEPDYECLVESILPFAEDIRAYRFPPLDKILTVSGKSVTSHRNLPNDKLMKSMSDFVDSMNLMNGDDEQMPMDDTFSPVLHTVEAAIKHRAVHPGKPLEEKSDMLVSYSKQPKQLQTQSKDALTNLIKHADVKKVPPKVKGRKRFRETEKPISGLDVAELFKKEKRIKISPDNAIPEFKQSLENVQDFGIVKDAVKQLATIIEDQIKTSFGDRNYAKAIEALGVMREEALDFEEPSLYNDILRQLKKKMFSEQLGGNRRDLWWQIRVGKLGLIDKNQSEQSDVTRDQAEIFMTSKEV